MAAEFGSVAILFQILQGPYIEPEEPGIFAPRQAAAGTQLGDNQHGSDGWNPPPELHTHPGQIAGQSQQILGPVVDVKALKRQRIA